MCEGAAALNAPLGLRNSDRPVVQVLLAELGEPLHRADGTSRFE
ncbi:hypothetical protein [Streptomyces sp. PA5.6]